MITLIIEFTLIGIIGGLLGMFYRNCLKPKGMIFNFIYYGYLKPWAEYYEDLEESGLEYKETFFRSFLAWIAKPLGYCIYCSTTWITFILCGLYLLSWEILPGWQYIVLAVITASVVQHLIVVISCRWLINGHPDLDTTYL